MASLKSHYNKTSHSSNLKKMQIQHRNVPECFRRGCWVLTGFGVFVLCVGQGQVGIGSARQTGAASGLDVGSAPQPDGVLGGHHPVRLGVCIRAYAE